MIKSCFPYEPKWTDGAAWRSASLAPSGWRRVGDVVLAIAILGLVGLIAARLDRVETRQTSGRAIVNDGDTITLPGEKVRSGHRCSGIQPDLPPGRPDLPLRPVGTRGAGRSHRRADRRLRGLGTDRYGRFLGTCSAGSTELNRSLVARGWAVAYGDFEAEEEEARQRRVGLWAGEFDPPRRWREMHGDMVDSAHDLTNAVLNWLRQMFSSSQGIASSSSGEAR